LKRFATAENVLKTMSLNNAFWWYLKRFGTVEKMVTMSLKHAFSRYWKRFGTVETL